ncbi:CHAD domain-containing protein [Paraburkholderia sp. CNPSo 3272]|uniref:CYTH and CHAD domain-containing protein n=1 Tax=Paraburkholderia sp. CNPSo 3272 TaxID=2940931 RepID=UPI0020B8FEE5|nr:CYTH and CHAD domain-containing protein [Paraburkholderia sp. CNPSo 3272]MCP3726278.1 CHAD domain-containing protein [Paraburkholderia sp. CNPSo 3272]
MERELKLRIAPGDLDKLRHTPFLAHGQAEANSPHLLTSTYFDTPELAIHRCKASLRVRADGQQRTQTLKLEGVGDAGVFDRDEFEMPVDRDTPDLALLSDAISADTECGKLIRDQAVVSQIAPVFVTRINRTVIVLRLPPEDEIEVALDEGTVDSQARSVPLAGVELELKRGNPQALHAAALELLKVAPLRIDHRSKADVGYELLVAEHAEAVKAEPVCLGKSDSIEDAFCTIAHNCLAQVHANERGVVSGHDPSCVHQMRVGLRRLRSALDLFDKMIPAYSGLDDELRWIAAELGAARDWEVLAGATLDRAGADGNAGEMESVRQACTQMAVDNRKRAAAAAESVRYTRLVLELTLWLDAKKWRDAMTDKQLAAIDRPARQFAAAVLSGRHGKLIKRGKRLAELDDHRRHRARIAAKKVRYATEFFASLSSKHAVQHYIKALTALQDDLGWRNDAVVADQLLRTVSKKSSAAVPGAAFARGYLASRVAADQQTLKKLWKRFRRLSPPH